MATTIQISDEVKKALDRMKVMDRESYNDVIEVLIEDNLELSDEAKKDLERARKEIDKGEFISHGEVKKRIGLNV